MNLTRLRRFTSLLDLLPSPVHKQNPFHRMEIVGSWIRVEETALDKVGYWLKVYTLENKMFPELGLHLGLLGQSQ